MTFMIMIFLVMITMILLMMVTSLTSLSLNKMMAACSDIKINKEMNSIEVIFAKLFRILI